MSSVHPPPANVPLDYCYALDAAMTMLGGDTSVIFGVRELVREVRHRIPGHTSQPLLNGALWIEPLSVTWRHEVRQINDTLPAGARLVVITSRPLARILPERRSWSSGALGLQPRGNARLRHALAGSGFEVEATYGMHTIHAIGINMLSRFAGAIGRPALSDRLHFAARLCYCTSGRLAPYSTVGLLVMRRVRKR